MTESTRALRLAATMPPDARRRRPPQHRPADHRPGRGRAAAGDRRAAARRPLPRSRPSRGGPGTAKTLMARCLAASMDAALQAGPVHARPAPLGHHRDQRLPALTAAPSSFAPGRSSPTPCSPTRSTALPPRPRPRSSRRWRSARSPATASGCRWAVASWWWPRRTRSSTRGPTRFPEAAARPLLPQAGGPGPGPRRRGRDAAPLRPGLRPPRPGGGRDRPRWSTRRRLDAARAEVAKITVQRRDRRRTSARSSPPRAMSPDLSLGASPRGAIALLLGGKAMAALRSRDFVAPGGRQGHLRPGAPIG